MSTVVVNSRADSNGVLHLEVPLGRDAAGQAVQVTVVPVRQHLTQDEWRKFIADTAGTWRGEFERPSQGEFETRDPL